MINPQDAFHLGVVTVHLFKGDTEPFALPDPVPAWRSEKTPDIRDTVAFFCQSPFEVRFDKGKESPFEDDLAVTQVGNHYVAYGTLRQDAAFATYPYTLVVDGQEADPDVVVKKDPRNP